MDNQNNPNNNQVPRPPQPQAPRPPQPITQPSPPTQATVPPVATAPVSTPPPSSPPTMPTSAPAINTSPPPPPQSQLNQPPKPTTGMAAPTSGVPQNPNSMAASPQTPPQPMMTPPPVPQMNASTPTPNPSLNKPLPSHENPTIQQQGPGGGKQVKTNPLKKIVAIVIGLLIVIGGGAAAYFFFINQNQSADQPAVVKNQTSSTGQNLVPAGETVTIEYRSLWESESVVRPVLDEFESANPGLTIVFTQESPQDYRERLQSDLARGQGPDIFRIHNTWVPMFRNELSGLPASIMSTQEFQETFYPVISRDLTVDNQIVGMPLMIDGLALYYNTEMFNTAGKQVPTSWDELRRTAVDLTISEGTTIKRAGISLGLAENVDHFGDILGLMLLQNGANPADPTDSLAQDAINFYLIFNRTDRLWNATLPPSTFAFANEQTAMMIGPSWRAHEISAQNPSLEFMIAPLPQLPDREVSWATYWVESVSNQSEHPEIAWALLEFMSQKESLRKMYTQASQERLFGNPFPRIDMADQLIGDPYVGAYIQQAPIAYSWPMANRTFDQGINDRIIKYYQDLINAGGGMEALQTVANGVTQVLSQYGESPSLPE